VGLAREGVGAVSTPRDDILNAALQLSEDDRMVIAGRLLETLPDDPPGLAADGPDFEAELERRSGDWEGAISWEELRDESRRSP